MKVEVQKRLFGVIKNVVDIDPASIDLDKPIRDQVCLDSMQFVGLIAQVEMEFETELPISIMQVSTLRVFIDEVTKVVHAS